MAFSAGFIFLNDGTGHFTFAPDNTLPPRISWGRLGERLLPRLPTSMAMDGWIWPCPA